MNYPKKWFILSFLFTFLFNHIISQVETVISDGYMGIYISELNDTFYINYVTKGSPAARQGIKTGDIILEINGIQASGVNLNSYDIDKLFNYTGGKSNALTVLPIDTDSPKTCIIENDVRPDLGRWIYFFEYLVDSTGGWTISDILSDSINALFTTPVNNKIKIHDVQKGSTADNAGLLPGDRIISFRARLDQLDDLMERGDYIDPGVSNDSVMLVERDSSLIEFYLDPEEDPLSGVTSQYGYDLRQKCIWIRFITLNKITKDRIYLLSNNRFDTVALYEIQANGAIDEKKTGISLPNKEKDFILRTRNCIKVLIRKDERQVFYMQLVKTHKGEQIFPDVFFGSLDSEIARDRISRLFFGILWGMTLIIAVYYLILSFFVRETSYIYYFLFAFTITLLMVYNSNYYGEVIPRLAVYEKGRLMVLFGSVPITFYLLFGYTYLNLRENLKTWSRVIQLYLGLIWICIIIHLISYNLFLRDLFAIIDQISNNVLLFAPLIYIVPSVLRIKHGAKHAWYFLLANISFIAIILWWWFLGTNMDLIYASRFMVVLIQASVEISLVLQILIFAIGLGHKMRIMETEKRLAQEKIIEQLKENEKLKDKVNRELEDKVRERTKEISLQKEEIESQRDELEQQKDILTEQKQEITDSINYAQKIQEAVLPDEILLNDLLPEHFVLFKPRDIVSGDYYWIRQIKNFTVIVVADCTGHGVPGAFMSMLGISMLNEIVSRSRFDNAGEILNRLRKKIKDTLKQEGKEEEQKDGMDMSLAIIDNDSNDLQYAGAFNPLYLIRRKDQMTASELIDKVSMELNQHRLIEIKGDRQPIAIYSAEKEFKTNHLEIKKDDTLYMFSDGYADQMGGPRGKKFMAKQFKELLLSIQDESMNRQKEILNVTLEDWIKDVQQLDDILVFGIRCK